MTKRLTIALRTRDEKGLHMRLINRDYAKSLVRGSCVTKTRRGQMGERFVILANGLTLVLDRLTAKQLREWRDF